VAFAFRISAVWLAIAVVAAVFMGIIGGMLPSFRAARTPITAALRDA
jgi:ABC-type antimicrobial peptide transport system permease subunit